MYKITIRETSDAQGYLIRLLYQEPGKRLWVSERFTVAISLMTALRKIITICPEIVTDVARTEARRIKPKLRKLVGVNDKVEQRKGLELLQGLIRLINMEEVNKPQPASVDNEALTEAIREEILRGALSRRSGKTLAFNRLIEEVMKFPFEPTFRRNSFQEMDKYPHTHKSGSFNRASSRGLTESEKQAIAANQVHDSFIWEIPKGADEKRREEIMDAFMKKMQRRICGEGDPDGITKGVHEEFSIGFSPTHKQPEPKKLAKEQSPEVPLNTMNMHELFKAITQTTDQVITGLQEKSWIINPRTTQELQELLNNDHTIVVTTEDGLGQRYYQIKRVDDGGVEVYVDGKNYTYPLGLLHGFIAEASEDALNIDRRRTTFRCFKNNAVNMYRAALHIRVTFSLPHVLNQLCSMTGARVLVEIPGRDRLPLEYVQHIEVPVMVMATNHFEAYRQLKDKSDQFLDWQKAQANHYATLGMSSGPEVGVCGLPTQVTVTDILMEETPVNAEREAVNDISTHGTVTGRVTTRTSLFERPEEPTKAADNTGTAEYKAKD